MQRSAQWIIIGAIVLVYLVLGAQYASRTPDWQAPDEPAHYNYVRQLVEDGALPELKMGDWQQDYQVTLVASGFNPAVRDCLDPPDYLEECRGLESVEYEDHQPPLYYLLQAPVYAVTDGDLGAMRLFSLVIGGGVIIAVWAALRLLMPRWPGMAATGAAFVAFLPQRLSIMASVSNDALAELIVALTLLAATVYLGAWHQRAYGDDGAARDIRRDVHPLVLGLLAGTAMWTKTTIYFLGGVVVLTVLLRARRESFSRTRLIEHLAWVLIPALLMGGLWWGRNLAVYGGLDFTALARHDEVTVGQLRTEDYIEKELGGSTRLYLENYANTTFHSFWGQFGWMALPMPNNVYRLFLLFVLGVLIGCGLFAWRHQWPRQMEPQQVDVIIVYAVSLGLVIAAYLLYNRDFVQFQGRYLYPALLPMAAIVAIGLFGWVSLLENSIPALEWLPVTLMVGLAVFAWYALETYIEPNLPVW